MKLFLILICVASLGFNVWQINHTSGLEDAIEIQRTGIIKQRKVFDQMKADLAIEKQNSVALVNSAHQILEKTDQLLRENGRLLAENAAYRQRYGAVEVPGDAPKDLPKEVAKDTPKEAAAVTAEIQPPKEMPPKPTPTPTPKPAPASAKPLTIPVKPSPTPAAAKPTPTPVKTVSAKKKTSLFWNDDSRP